MSVPPPPPPPGTPPPPPPPGGWNTPGLGIDMYASFWIRFAGTLIDGLLLGAVNFSVQAATDEIVSTFVGFVIGIAYTVIFLGSASGQTVGMRLLGIRAVDAQNYGRIDYGRAAVRYLVSIVSGLACAIGYLWMLWDPARQTWHDKAAGTIVVKVSEFPVERWPG